MLSSSLENAQHVLNQQARLHAITSVTGATPSSGLPLLASDAGSAPIRYHSQGRTLLVGSEARLRALASVFSRLPATTQLSVALLVSEQDNSALVALDEQHLISSEILNVHGVPRDMLILSGHLGQFSVSSDGVSLAPALLPTDTARTGHFDLIADLADATTQPLNRAELPPPGYLRASEGVLAEIDRLVVNAQLTESELPALQAWVMQFAGMIGSFDKPNYVTVNLDTCAHSSAGNIGCTRCLSSCSADAIFSVAGRRNAHIEIDPYLCHGAASCVSTCPTGALSFTQPPAEQRMEHIQRLLERYQDGGGVYPLLRYRLEQTTSPLSQVDQQRCLDITLEEISATGHDEWLAALALGATQVIVEIPQGLGAGQHQQLESEKQLALSLLDSMGLAATESGEPRIRFMAAAQSFDIVKIAKAESAAEAEALALISPLCIPLAPGADTEEEHQPGQPIARDWLLGRPDARPGKRERLNRVLDHLASLTMADLSPVPVAIPVGAPFGIVSVDSDSCTLCQACVAVCPTSALSANRTSPALSFTQGDCVQCGLCEQACPEQVITLIPGFAPQPDVRREPQRLKQDVPFPCISCGTPFGSTATITAMQTKLASHAYFQGDGALRLKMCSDCRVKDIWHEMARNPDAQLKV